jgi:hypothetical protein
MATLLGYLFPFLIYYVIIYVVSYIVVEYGQNYLYDEVTSGAAGKVGLGTLIPAAILTWSHSSFADMFTSEIWKTAILAIAWVGVFILIYRFHPWHGLGLGVATLLIFAGMSTLVVDSMLKERPKDRLDTSVETKTIRRPAYGAQPAPKVEPEVKK